MINPTANAHVYVNNADIRKKNQIFELTQNEKQEFLSSLPLLSPDFEKFVKSFYKSFLEINTLKLVQNKSNESLINLLSSSLNIIICTIEHPIPIDDYMDILITKHPDFKEMIKNKDLFVKSFIYAIIDTFASNYNDRIGAIWTKAIANFVVSVNLFLNH
jgi:hemoglobin-like flavoprotein